MRNDLVKKYRKGRSDIHVGRFTYGFENIEVRQWSEGAALRIGSFCSIARKITIFLGGNHRIDWITTFPFGHVFDDEIDVCRIDGHPATNGDVVIGNDVWIAHGVTIMSGVTVGDGAVLAANSCVARNVAPYQLVGGNPAAAIKKRFDDNTIELLLQLKWWELPIQDIKNIHRQLCSKPSREGLLDLISRYRR